MYRYRNETGCKSAIDYVPPSINKLGKRAVSM